MSESLQNSPMASKRGDSFFPKEREHDSCAVGAIADLSGRFSAELRDEALQALENMEHRGGEVEEQETDGSYTKVGDGAGVLAAVDMRHFFEPTLVREEKRIPEGEPLIAGTFFLLRPNNGGREVEAYQTLIRDHLGRAGFIPLGFRTVPTNPEVLGRTARETAPTVIQVLAGKNEIPGNDFKRRLWETTQSLERCLREQGGTIVSMSDRTLVYKVLGTGPQLRKFYPDLSDLALRAKIMLLHRRFSTNTEPSWANVQPGRLIGENGEKNAFSANTSAVKGLELETGADILPETGASDSITFDRYLSWLVHREGISLAEALVRSTPPAWNDAVDLPPGAKEYFDANRRNSEALSEWEGPMYTVATDGKVLVGKADRMGLRPTRILRDVHNQFKLMSEFDAFDTPPENIVETGQLCAGEIVVADPARGEVLYTREVLKRVVAETKLNVRALTAPRTFIVLSGGQEIHADDEASERYLSPQHLMRFGWTRDRLEEADDLLRERQEPRSSMGRDWVPAILSRHRRPLSDYFFHGFACITNPVIEPGLEGEATDMEVYLGSQPEGLFGAKVHPQYRLSQPIVTPSDLMAMEKTDGIERPEAVPLDCSFDREQEMASGKSGRKILTKNIQRIVDQVLEMARNQTAGIVVFTHRHVDERRMPLPMLLIVGKVHEALIREGLRNRVSLVVDSSEIQNLQAASMNWLSGADALCPQVLFAKAKALGLPPQSVVEAFAFGLRKNMCRNGITTFVGYRGARLFGSVGVSEEITNDYLGGVKTYLPGYNLQDVWEDLLAWYTQAENLTEIPDRVERHAYSPKVIRAIQDLSETGDYTHYLRLIELLEEEKPLRLRHLVDFRKIRPPISIEEVMSAEDIVKYFIRGAHISEGAVWSVPHEAQSLFFNRVGSFSGNGEGGQSDERHTGGIKEDCMSRDRQKASAGFGIRALYFADPNVQRITHKDKQGAKPPDGGNMPRRKNRRNIPELRYVEPGTSLQSPANLLDALSIEDWDPLILMTRELNLSAQQSVKTSLPTHMGPIVLGITKAGTDVISLSGGEGSTGSATRNAIEYFGYPLDLNIAVAHQVLLKAGLRGSVLLNADGGLVTGEDIALIIGLGADEVALGTLLSIALGCIYKRACHLDGIFNDAGKNMGCPVGYAAQSDELTDKFLRVRKNDRDQNGNKTQDQLVELGAQRLYNVVVLGVATHIRKICAELGARSPAELRNIPLERVMTGNPRIDKINIDLLLAGSPEKRESLQPPIQRRIRRHETTQKSQRLLEDVFKAARQGKSNIVLEYEVDNRDRVIGGRLAGEMIRQPEIFKGKIVTVRLKGSVGNGAYFAAAPGMHLELQGFGNDSFCAAIGEGVSVTVVPPETAKDLRRVSASTLGNNAFLSSTGGVADVMGGVGQRAFACNSGLDAIQEGPRAKYLCEFMRRGRVICIGGKFSNEIAPGMTGGQLYIHDCPDLAERIHKKSVVARLMSDEEAEKIRIRIVQYYQKTGKKSTVAAGILENWDEEKRKFQVVESKEQREIEKAKVEEKSFDGGALSHVSLIQV